jgi:hypothetical protein
MAMKNLLISLILILLFKINFAQWVAIQTPVTNNLWGISVVSKSLIFAAGQNIIVKSTNGGASWSTMNVPQGFNSSIILITAVNENNIWIASGSVDGTIFHTTNGGQSWTAQFLSYTAFINYINFFNDNSGIILADSQGFPGNDTLGFFYTRNGGQTWKRPPNCPIINFVGFGYSGCKDTNLIWTTAVINNSVKLCKLSGGFESPWQNYFVSGFDRVVFMDNLNGLAVTGGSTYQTTNGGANWIFKNNQGLTGGTPIQYLDNIKGTSWIIALGRFRSRISYDYCSNWGEPGIFSSNIRASQMGNYDSTSIYIACDSGIVLKYDSDKKGINPISDIVPEKFNLYQNYPNPFNPTTTIKFDIPPNQQRTTNNVQLIIFDILGREVSTLVNEQLKPGTYEVVWPAPSGDASNFSSGVYYYQLRTGNYIDTKKLALIK